MAISESDTGKRISATWTGEQPRVGDFLCSQHRPRYAYRITHVRAVRAYPGAAAKLALTVDRVPAGEIPADATVHPWTWAPRSRKHPDRPRPRTF